MKCTMNKEMLADFLVDMSVQFSEAGNGEKCVELLLDDTMKKKGEEAEKRMIVLCWLAYRQAYRIAKELCEEIKEEDKDEEAKKIFGKVIERC